MPRKQVPPTAADGGEFVTIAQAAALYGVSPRTVRRWVTAGQLRAYRVGPEMIRLRRGDVLALARPIPAGQLADW